MGKEQTASHPLLTAAVAADFPGYSEIAVSFPDQWQLVKEIRAADTPLYIAGLPATEEPARDDHFHGLPTAVNLALTHYQLYTSFLPWPQPQLLVEFPQGSSIGHVIRPEGLTIRLHPIGQAQAHWGGGYGVIWECYVFGSSLRATWADELAGFWQAIERAMDAETIYTEPREPDFPAGELTYTDFLAMLGYREDPTTPGWWSKRR